jgi:hypothetical membrane protein
MAPWAKVFATVSAVGAVLACAGDFVVPLVIARSVPGYSHLRNVMSELGTRESPVARWMNLWWIVFGVLMMAFGVGVALAFPAAGDAGRLLACQFLVFGLGAGIGAGLFPMDPAGSAATVPGWLHGLTSSVGFVALGFAPLVTLWVVPRADVGWLWWLAAVVQALGFVVFALIVVAGHGRGGGALSWAGFWQRAFLAVYYVYAAALAVEMVRRGAGAE